jgi:hypothetical protein
LRRFRVLRLPGVRGLRCCDAGRAVTISCSP